MYSKNIQNLLELIIGKDGAITLNMDDEIIAGATVTHQHEILHEGTRKAMGLVTQAPPPPQTSEPPQEEPDAPAAAETGSGQSS